MLVALRVPALEALLALRPTMLLAHGCPVNLAPRLSPVAQGGGPASRFVRGRERNAGPVLKGPAKLWSAEKRLGGPPPLAAALLHGQVFDGKGASR